MVSGRGGASRAGSLLPGLFNVGRSAAAKQLPEAPRPTSLPLPARAAVRRENPRRQERMPAFSVFIPVLDEEDILRPNTLRLIEFLEALGAPFEIIIGSNGSRDRTGEQGRRLAREIDSVRFFHLAGRGPGAAFARAVKLCSAPMLITLDMDLSVDLAFIPRALELLGDHDVVVGSKFQGRQERSWARVAGSGLYIVCARLLLGLPYRDYSLGAKAFRLEALRPLAHLIDRNTAYIGNLVFAARAGGLSIVEEPVACSDQRRSRFNLAAEAAYRLGWLGKLFYFYRIKKRNPAEVTFLSRG